MLYTVEKGDTLYKISERHDTSLEVLMEVSTKFHQRYLHTCGPLVITSYWYASVTNKRKQLRLAKLLRFSRALFCCFMSSPFVSCLLEVIFLWCRQMGLKMLIAYKKDKSSGSLVHTRLRRWGLQSSNVFLMVWVFGLSLGCSWKQLSFDFEKINPSTTKGWHKGKRDLVIKHLEKTTCHWDHVNVAKSGGCINCWIKT